MTCALEATRRVPGSIGDRLNLRRGREVVPGLRTSRVQGGNIDVELGTGFGFTPGSDRFIVKAIFGYAFPVPSKSTEADSSPKSLKMGAPSRRYAGCGWIKTPIGR